VRLYFDQNDEMVDEETAMSDKNNFYHKYHAVEVIFSTDDDDEYRFSDVKKPDEILPARTNKVTKEMFYGEKPQENMEIFVDTLQKTRVQHLKKVEEKDLAGPLWSSESETSFTQETLNKDSQVIMDLNPERYEKPKDHLFFDFFSMYAKNFIKQRNGGSPLKRSYT